MPQAAPPRRAANWRAVASVAAAVVLAGAAVALVRMRPAPQANAATLPAPAPVHVEPAVPPPAAPAPPATGPIGINVVSTAPGAEVTFRGQTVPLPWHAEVTRGTVPEVIRVTAPHYQGRLFWVSLDRQRFMAVDLKPGKGVVEATPAETAVALGETAPTQAPAPHASGPRPLTLAGILGPAPEPVAPAPPVVVAAPPPPAPAPAAEAPRAPAPAPAPVAAPAPVKTPEPVTPTTLPFSSYVTSHRSSGAEPRVPPALLAQISEGHAMAHICVDTNGQVADMRLLRASPGVDDAVRQAVRTWRYRPFMSKGKPIPVCFDMPFEFHRN